MQESSTPIPHWAMLLYGLATFVGGGTVVRFLTLWLNRKKPVVEVQKTEAETTEITIRAHAAAGDSMIRLMNRLDDALDTIDTLREERNELRQKADTQELELKSYERQMKHMHAIMELKGVKWADFDTPKE